jgi:hypothetical protein
MSLLQQNKEVIMKREFNVAIPKGYFMSWFVTTQAAFRITVTLKDDKKTYFSNTKQSTDIDPPLAYGYDYISGENLKIIVDIPQSKQILGSPHSNDITTDNGIVVGKEFNLCLEDSTDNDYNDVAISIVAWKNKG